MEQGKNASIVKTNKLFKLVLAFLISPIDSAGTFYLGFVNYS